MTVEFPTETTARVEIGINVPEPVPYPPVPHLVTFMTRQLTNLDQKSAHWAAGTMRAALNAPAAGLGRVGRPGLASSDPAR